MGQLKQEQPVIFTKMLAYVGIRHGKQRFDTPCALEAHSDLWCAKINRQGDEAVPDCEGLLELLKDDEQGFFAMFADAAQILASHDAQAHAA